MLNPWYDMHSALSIQLILLMVTMDDNADTSEIDEVLGGTTPSFKFAELIQHKDDAGSFEAERKAAAEAIIILSWFADNLDRFNQNALAKIHLDMAETFEHWSHHVNSIDPTSTGHVPNRSTPATMEDPVTTDEYTDMLAYYANLFFEASGHSTLSSEVRDAWKWISRDFFSLWD